ncbi:hypothetical protein H8957_012531 [Semnopithecus entellus]
MIADGTAVEILGSPRGPPHAAARPSGPPSPHLSGKAALILSSVNSVLGEIIFSLPKGKEDVREVWGTLSHGANPKSPLPAVVAVGTVPVELGAVGFTSVGIAASFIAAKMTSTAATANGGGVGAGSLVATLQSVEAAGLSVTSKVILGSAGTALGAWLSSSPSTPPAEHCTEVEKFHSFRKLCPSQHRVQAPQSPGGLSRACEDGQRAGAPEKQANAEHPFPETYYVPGPRSGASCPRHTDLASTTRHLPGGEDK